MTDKIMEARRAKFDVWFEAQCPTALGKHHEELFFSAWNAALDSLCIDLPFRVPDGDDYTDGYCIAIETCRDCIHAAGVKTR